MSASELDEGEARPEAVDFTASHIKPNGHAADFTGLHVKYGAPAATYEYRDAQGELTFFVCRYPLDDGTEALCPWCYNGSAWISRAPAAPRSLFGLELLATNPDRPVLLVDSEPIAAAARRLIRPEANLILSWYGGPDSIAATDWQGLSGRTVTLWPTASAPHWSAAARIGALLFGLRCEVAVIDTHASRAGWSLLDGIQEGMDRHAIIEFAKRHKRPVRTSAQAAQMAIPVRGASDGPVARLGVEEAHELPDHLTHSEIWSHYGLETLKGLPWANLDNATRVIARHPQLSQDLWYDDFRGLTMSGTAQWDDEHSAVALQLWMQRSVKLAKMPLHVVRDAVGNYARTRKRHPVREMIDAYAWDGVDRVSTWLTRAFEVESSPYASAVGRIWLVSMIARVYEPGCQLRTMVVLEGEQNSGKTKACSILAGDWHSECLESMATKDFFQSLAGKWLVEVSELESFSRASIERVKAAVSARSDYFRESYGRRALEHPRQCVLIGTTNSHQWMADESGGTRFLPLRTARIDLAWLAANRVQLLAEARSRFLRGEDWYVVPREEAAAQVESRYIADPWEEHVAQYLVGRADVSVSELLGWIGIELEDRDARHNRRIGAILRHLGWRPQPKTAWREGRAVKLYAPPPQQRQPSSDPADDVPF
jgi:predicted P-loop ATPase